MMRVISLDVYLCNLSNAITSSSQPNATLNLCKTNLLSQFQIQFEIIERSESPQLHENGGASSEDEWGPEPKEENGSSVGIVTTIEEEKTEVEPKGEEIEKPKRGLVDLLHRSNWGLKAMSKTRAEILEIITQLEPGGEEPQVVPTEVLTLLDGKRILAYTSSQSGVCEECPQ